LPDSFFVQRTALTIPVSIDKECQEKIKSLAIFAGFVVHSFRFSIAIADFKNVVKNSQDTGIGFPQTDLQKAPSKSE
jgi:hypothetical protein